MGRVDKAPLESKGAYSAAAAHGRAQSSLHRMGGESRGRLPNNEDRSRTGNRDTTNGARERNHQGRSRRSLDAGKHGGSHRKHRSPKRGRRSSERKRRRSRSDDDGSQPSRHGGRRSSRSLRASADRATAAIGAAFGGPNPTLVEGCAVISGLAEARAASLHSRATAASQHTPSETSVDHSKILESLFSFGEETTLPHAGHHLAGLIDFARFSPTDQVIANKVAARLSAPVTAGPGGWWSHRFPITLTSQIGTMDADAFVEAFNDQSNEINISITSCGQGLCVALKLYNIAQFAVRSCYYNTDFLSQDAGNATAPAQGGAGPSCFPNAVPPLTAAATGVRGLPPAPAPEHVAAPAVEGRNADAFREDERRPDPRPREKRPRSKRQDKKRERRSYSESSDLSRAARKRQARRTNLAIERMSKWANPRKVHTFMSDEDVDEDNKDLDIAHRISEHKLELIGAAALLPEKELASFCRVADKASRSQPFIAEKPFTKFVPHDFGTKSPLGAPVDETSRALARAARVSAGPNGIAQVIQAAHTFWATHAFAQDHVDPAAPAHHCALLVQLATNHGNRFAEAYETALQQSLVIRRSTPGVKIDLNEACYFVDREIHQRLEFEATARYSKSGRDRAPPAGGFPDKSAKNTAAAKARLEAAKASKAAVAATSPAEGVLRSLAKARVKGNGKSGKGRDKIDEPCRLHLEGKCKMGDQCKRNH